MEASAERSLRGLPLTSSPIKVFEDSPVQGIRCKKDITSVDGDTMRVTIQNDTENGIIVPRRIPVGNGELASIQENVLQEMSEVLESIGNRNSQS